MRWDADVVSRESNNFNISGIGVGERQKSMSRSGSWVYASAAIGIDGRNLGPWCLGCVELGTSR